MPRASRAYRSCAAFLRFLGRAFWKVRAEGRATIPCDGPLIVAATHESFLDPPLIGCYMPRALRYVARRTLFVKGADGKPGAAAGRKRWLTWFERWVGVIEVDKDAGGRDALRKCIAALEQGDAVLFFPEGTRSPDGSVREFRPGVGFLALRSGAVVVPVSVAGTRRVWPKERKFPRLGAGPVRVVYGEPVKYEKPMDAEEVAADIRRRILDLRAGGQQADARDGA